MSINGDSQLHADAAANAGVTVLLSRSSNFPSAASKSVTFQDLPSEIRQKIYGEVFIFGSGNSKEALMAALCGDKKLYFEALALFYQFKDISYRVYWPQSLGQSLPTSSYALSLIRKLSIIHNQYFEKRALRFGTPSYRLLDRLSNLRSLTYSHFDLVTDLGPTVQTLVSSFCLVEFSIKVPVEIAPALYNIRKSITSLSFSMDSGSRFIMMRTWTAERGQVLKFKESNFLDVKKGDDE